MTGFHCRNKWNWATATLVSSPMCPIGRTKRSPSDRRKCRGSKHLSQRQRRIKSTLVKRPDLRRGKREEKQRNAERCTGWSTENCGAHNVNGKRHAAGLGIKAHRRKGWNFYLVIYQLGRGMCAFFPFERSYVPCPFNLFSTLSPFNFTIATPCVCACRVNNT